MFAFSLSPLPLILLALANQQLMLVWCSELGFGRIAELDRKLASAELKYLESQKSLRELQEELATPHDSRWDSPTGRRSDKYDDAQHDFKTKVRPSLKCLTTMEAANAMRGMNSLLTAEEAWRVAAILAEDDEREEGGEGGEGIYLETGTLGVYCVCSAGDAARLRGELRVGTVKAKSRRSCPRNASPDET